MTKKNICATITTEIFFEEKETKRIDVLNYR